MQADPPTWALDEKEKKKKKFQLELSGACDTRTEPAIMLQSAALSYRNGGKVFLEPTEAKGKEQNILPAQNGLCLDPRWDGVGGAERKDPQNVCVCARARVPGLETRGPQKSVSSGVCNTALLVDRDR